MSLRIAGGFGAESQLPTEQVELGVERNGFRVRGAGTATVTGVFVRSQAGQDPDTLQWRVSLAT